MIDYEKLWSSLATTLNHCIIAYPGHGPIQAVLNLMLNLENNARQQEEDLENSKP